MGSTGTLTFPRTIDFEAAAQYIQSFEKAPGGVLVFDLEDTIAIHYSFIGFMIHMKKEMENSGGRLIVKLSPTLKKTIQRLNLDGFFPEHAHVAQPAQELHISVN